MTTKAGPLRPNPQKAQLLEALGSAERERDEQQDNVRKLLGDAARLQEQLTSATQDIFTLQVGLCAHLVGNGSTCHGMICMEHGPCCWRQTP
jgi:hypothetical protein